LAQITLSARSTAGDAAAWRSFRKWGRRSTPLSKKWARVRSRGFGARWTPLQAFGVVAEAIEDPLRHLHRARDRPGSFGCVVLAKNSETGELVAIKKMVGVTALWRRGRAARRRGAARVTR
jgi:hypothetical protein